MEASREGIHERIDRSEQKSESRLAVVESVLRSTHRTVGSIEKRFDALEAALQRIDQETRSRDASLELAIRDLKVSALERHRA